MSTDFIAGFAAAAAEIVRTHGESAIAADVIRANGITLADFESSKIDDYDMVEIKRLFKHEPVLREAGGTVENRAAH